MFSFLQFRFALTLVDNALDDQYDNENLQRKKGQATPKIKK